MKKIINKLIEKPYIVLLIIFCISIFPMLFLGVYAYPQADDFAFSGNTHNAWINNHSIIEVIKQAVLTSIFYWEKWAGTFSSVFFFALQPEAFCNRGYVIVPFLFIGMLSASIWLMVNTIMTRILKFNSNTSRTVTSFVLIYVIWNMPNACQAFYWYNSAAHYILSFSMMLVTTSIIIIGSQSRHSILLMFLASITSIMVGGGNFISALLMAILYFFFGTYFIYIKHKKMVSWIIPAILLYVSFILNVVAPGNTERQNVMSVEPDNPINAIINSFGYALHYCFSEWMNVFVVLLILIMIPFIWKGLEKCEFSFKYPAVVVLMSFCLISAMFAPAAYAEKSAGPGRVQNIIFVFYIICLVLDEVYILGWLKIKNPSMNIKWSLRMYLGVCTALVMFFGLISYRHNDKYCNVLTALSIIKNGQAKEYAAIVSDNMEILNSDETVVTIHKIVDGPYFFYSREIDDWKSGTKAYFNKELIIYEE